MEYIPILWKCMTRFPILRIFCVHLHSSLHWNRQNRPILTILSYDQRVSGFLMPPLHIIHILVLLKIEIMFLYTFWNAYIGNYKTLEVNKNIILSRKIFLAGKFYKISNIQWCQSRKYIFWIFILCNNMPILDTLLLQILSKG